MEAGTALAQAGTALAQAGTALAQAREAMRLADTEPGRAAPVAAAAVRAGQRARDPATVALAERAWGHSLLVCGQVDAAVDHLRRSVAYGRRAASAALVAEARSKLAYAMVMRGRPQAALTEIDAALRDLDGASAARARAQRAVILSEIGRLDDALADFQAALPALRAASDELGVARMLVNRGILLGQRHAFAAAVKDLREAELLSRRMGRHLAVGIIAQNLGVIETFRGDVPAALAHLDRAEQTVRAHGGRIASVLLDRGALLLSVGLAAEARQAAERAVQAFQREGRRLKVPEVRLLLAQAAAVAGDWRTAAAHANLAMRELNRQRRVEWAALARLAALRAGLAAGDRIQARQVDAMVRTLAGAGWPDAAVEAQLVAARLATRAGHTAAYLAAASRAAHRRGPATLRARGWYAEALLRLRGDNGTGALRAIRAGLRILDEHGASLGAMDLRVHSAAHRRELTELGLRLALRDGRPSRILEWAERGRASRLAYRPVRPPDDPVLAGLLSQLRNVARELAEATGATDARLVRRQVALERQIRDHSRKQRGEPDGPLWTPVPPATLSRALGDRMLIEFVQLDGVLYGLSLIRGRLRTRTIGPVEPIAALVQRMPFALHRLANQAAPARTRTAAQALLRHAAAALDAVLLRPFGELGDRALVVVPTGALHSVPWSVLPSCAGRPIAVSPSATLWHAAGTEQDGKTRGAGGVAVAAGPGLPGAREEARQVAAIHGTQALVERAATVAAVLAAMSAANVMHIAAHGRLSTDNPLFSDLLLADGPLVVYDLQRLDRTPHTVVLAACEGGRSVVYAGDELLGLSAAFIAQGTAQLVASVMPVPDAETAPLMVEFHRRLADGQPPAVALAAAQHNLHSADPPTLAAAAGFICLGS
jgi:tetratricopeptide (TPR) repeat protein